MNTLFPFVTNLQSNPQELSTALPMDIEIDTPRGQSVCTSFNSSREALAHSDALSMAYVDWIQVLANNPIWAEQVKSGELESLSLSYTFLKKGMNDSAKTMTAIKPTLILHAIEISNIYVS